MDYFKNPKHHGKTNLNEIVGGNNQFFNDIFREIYQNGEDNKELTVKNHKLFTDFAIFVSGSTKAEGENDPIDSIICQYLYKVADLCKKETFYSIFKFVTLYRDCLNHYNNAKSKIPGTQYTVCTNAEDAPDISNEFITEYLEDHDYFKQEEAIELTQNFCQWLYDNNYTCSKLTLMPPEESNN
jgi:hypothetical protein